MKLPNFLVNSDMNALRTAMGLRPDEFGDFQSKVDPGRLTPFELDKLISGEGIDVSFDALTILADGTLAYKNSRVLLYIRDHHPFQGHTPDPKYHFANCDVLVRMRNDNKFQKYVVATEVTGTFHINIFENGRPRGQHFQLHVCQVCLDKLSFDGFSLRTPKPPRQKYVAEFLPKRFFDVYDRDLIIEPPQHTAASAPFNTYPDNWGEISRAARNAANWSCSNCPLVLIVHKKKYLHVHHINGVRSDNRPENLKVVCLGCHAEEPGHQHMKSNKHYRQFISDTGWRPRRR